VYDPEPDRCIFSGEHEIDPIKRAGIYQKRENILYEDAFLRCVCPVGYPVPLLESGCRMLY
jgi:hypothetical protein